MLEKSIHEYYDYLFIKKSLKKAPYYRALYNKAFKYFLNKNISPQTCTDFLREIDSTGISPYTYNNYLKAFKKLINLHGHTYIDDYKLKKTELPYIPILEEEEMAKLINCAYRSDFRKGVITETYLRHGMRFNELAKLEWKNYYGDSLFIENTKSYLSRTIFILKDLSEKIEQLRGNNDELIFGSCRGQMTIKYYNIFLKQIALECGINAEKIKKFSSHKLRHSYASNAAANGINIKFIQENLGHRSVKTTETYIHTTIKMKKDMAKKMSYSSYEPSFQELSAEILKIISSYKLKNIGIDTKDSVLTIYKKC